MKRTAFCCLMLALGCGDDDSTPMMDAGADTSTMDSTVEMDTGGGDTGEEMRTLSYAFTGLPALGADFVYEGWLIVSDTPVSTGRFTIDGSGVPVPATSEATGANVDAATVFVLTIEPAVGDDPAPADTHVLAGAMASGSATLALEHPAALGDDFTGAAGSFILAAPSSAADDDNQGIWFLEPGDPPMPSLTLPTLPAGWAYEGWVVDTSGAAPAPTSTGRFTAVDAADSNGAGPAAGTEMTPPLPGEDFIDPATDLTMNHMAVLSIEPDPDDSAAPFQLKPLALPIGTDVGGANPYTLNNVIGMNGISGTATFE